MVDLTRITIDVKAEDGKVSVTGLTPEQFQEIWNRCAAISIETSLIESHIEMLIDAKELKRIGADKLPHRDLHHRVLRILLAYDELLSNKY